MIVRDLERGAMKITPDKIMMEGETVLTQYIIPYWNLDYVNKSMRKYQCSFCTTNERYGSNIEVENNWYASLAYSYPTRWPRL